MLRSHGTSQSWLLLQIGIDNRPERRKPQGSWSRTSHCQPCKNPRPSTTQWLSSPLQHTSWIVIVQFAVTGTWEVVWCVLEPWALVIGKSQRSRSAVCRGAPRSTAKIPEVSGVASTAARQTVCHPPQREPEPEPLFEFVRASLCLACGQVQKGTSLAVESIPTLLVSFSASIRLASFPVRFTSCIIRLPMLLFNGSTGPFNHTTS